MDNQKDFDISVNTKISDNENQIIFSSPQQVAPLAYKLYKSGVPYKKAERIIRNANYNFDTSHLDLDLIINKILSDIYSNRAYQGETKEIHIYPKERLFIQKYCENCVAPDLIKKIKGIDKISLLLYSYLVFSRYEDYESGWINYNVKKIFALAGLSRLSEKIKNEIVQSFISHEIIQLKVVGKKTPILCYKLPWRENEENNEFDIVTISPLTNAQDFAQQMNSLMQN